MDFFFFDKAEKLSTPIPRCNLLQIFSKFFRFLELSFLLLSLSWIFSRLPIALRISADYFTKLFAFIATPLFGFLLCNAIIVALVAKPSQFSRPATSDQTDRIYEDLIEKTGTGSDLTDSASEEVEEIVYQDKEIIAEGRVGSNYSTDCEIELKNTDLESDSGLGHSKVILRSLSEKLNRECVKTQSEKLRRSETEKCRNLEYSNDILYYQDDLSSEEFQRKIEAFIAKEKKFRREESSAIVVLHCDG
ncbi:putative TRNA--methyltransferase non-catalytic subunit trm6MTase subunit trm6 [Cucumis melo var. makuwa]|uniref:DUF4408 domain-containing protein n=2 Tax=Cucumis melo TaxID=3656 RepID=A0A9I9DCR1_CUCME|nr:putative TRNA--methyltransferase non-catalytic subunit trm6MTase subunit trm6 [Cucumis melo var. makuwa]